MWWDKIANYREFLLQYLENKGRRRNGKANLQAKETIT
jgi:hypothetical protein